MPVAAAARRGKVPFEEAVRSRTLANGARLFVLENRFNPTVAVDQSTGVIYAASHNIVDHERRQDLDR